MEKAKQITEVRLVLIGGSAGSLNVLLRIFPLLSKDFNIPIILVLHRAPNGEELLSAILSERTKMRVKEAEEKESIRPGTVYIAPADYHLLVEQNRTLSLDYSEKVNFSRPAIDVTFESAAEVYGQNLVAILLSGANADGAKGMQHISRQGGILVVQSPATADVAYMPEQAIEAVRPHHIFSPEEIASFLNTLVS